VLDGSFAVFEGGKARKVRIRFIGVAARLVGERVWHASQKLVREGRALLLEMKVGLSPDLRQWILGWGSEAEVLDPADLREDVAVAATAAAAVYRRSARAAKD
jgi:proteasome accessory factor B